MQISKLTYPKSQKAMISSAKHTYSLLLIFIFFFSVVTKGQELKVYSNLFIGSNDMFDEAFDAVESSDKGAIIVGITGGNNNGDIPACIKDNSDFPRGNLLIAKVSNQRTLDWVKVYGGTDIDRGTDICRSNAGGYGILGYTRSNDGDVSGHIGAARTGDLWLLKIDVNGILEWEKCYGSISGSEIPLSIAPTADSGFVILAVSNGVGQDVPSHYGEFDWLVIKVDKHGVKQWSRTLGGTGDEELRGEILVINGGYYIVGSSPSTNGECIDDSWHVGKKTYNDVYVLHLDEFGNTTWSKSFGGSDADYAFSAQFDSRDNSIIIGAGTYSKDYMLNGKHIGGMDSWLLKIDTMGSVKFSKVMGDANANEYIESVTTTPYGYLISANANPYIPSSTYQKQDIWLYSISSQGDNIADKIIGGSGVENNSTVINFGSSFAVIGCAWSQFRDGHNFPFHGTKGGDVFISFIDTWMLNIPANDKTRNVSIYPNPASVQFKVTCNSNVPYKVEVFNLLGNPVFTVMGRGEEEIINTANWPAGVYVVRITDDHGVVQVQRVMIQPQ